VGVKFGLPPVARSDATLFILGSLPGDASLAARRYYAHPTNQFWRLLGTAIGEDLQPLDYDRRLERLGERRIGLWDVIASASRSGSLDQSIREAEHNQLEHLALMPAPPEIAVQMYNRGTLPTMVTKLRTGQSMQQVIAWATEEIEGFLG